MDTIDIKRLNLTEEELDDLDEIGDAQLCVVRTIESMVSEIAGHQIKRDLLKTDLRRFKQQRQNISRRVISAQTRKTRKSVGFSEAYKSNECAALRQDLFFVKQFVQETQDKDSQLGPWLEKTMVKYVMGSFADAIDYMNQEYSVGIVALFNDGVKDIQMAHIFHIQRNGNGLLIDASDKDEPEIEEKVNSSILNGEIDAKMQKVAENIGGWNMLLMKK